MDNKIGVSNIFKGDKYRITVITERLVRLEYSESGIFNDLPTSLVVNRNFDKPEFGLNEGNTTLKIETKYFVLEYRKNKPFHGSKIYPTKNLKITLKGTERIWYYKHPEIRNFNSSIYYENNKLKKGKSLYSLDGFVSINDDTGVMAEFQNINKRNDKYIDMYVFMYNKDFYKCLNDYFNLTGRPIMLPRFAYGIWFSKDKFYKELELPKIASKFEREKVPISLFILSNWYKDDNLDPYSYYRDPQSIIDYFKEKKINIGLNINELKVDTFDIYNKDILNNIIDGINDMGINVYNLNILNKTEKLDKLKNMFYQKLNNLDNRALLCSYYTKGTHKLSTIYVGMSKVSFDTLKDIIKINTSSANLGISNIVHDIGGSIDGIEDNELYVRFIQLGTFSPILKLGSSGGKYYKREPWKWEIKTNKIATYFLELRYKLIPYIYTENYKYYKFGKTLIEPIYYRYPSLYDSDIYSNNYFFGGSIFISPIVSKKNETMNRVIHKLFIPHGIWYDFFTGKKFFGNKKYISFYKDEEYPVFAKAGSVIPMSLNQYNDTSIPTDMEIQVFPGNSNTYSIYEDDGISNKYKNGEYLITNIEYIFSNDKYKLTVLPISGKKGIIPNLRNYKIVFRNTKYPSIVSSFQGETPIINNCYTDGNDFIVEVNNIKTDNQLTIVLKGKNLEVDSMRIINDDIVSIISDLPIETDIKQTIDDIMFDNNIEIKDKRIKLKKLAHINKPLDKKYIKLFLNLLEYIEKV